MEKDMQKILDEQTKKIDAIYVSVEKTRKYFLVTMWVTLLAIVLPLIGVAIAVPSMMSTYMNMVSGGL